MYVVCLARAKQRRERESGCDDSARRQGTLDRVGVVVSEE